jgi:hypothetical protein
LHAALDRDLSHDHLERLLVVAYEVRSLLESPTAAVKAITAILQRKRSR